jgi:hypothetical protein
MMMVCVSLGHSPILVCLMVARSGLASSDVLLLACCFPLLVGPLSSLSDESGCCSRGVGGSGSSNCIRSGYASN